MKRSLILTGLLAVAVVAASCTTAVPPAGVACSADRLPARLGTPALSDVAYGPQPGQRLDVHLPTRGGNRGVIVTVHGGGFTSGNRGHVPAWFGPIGNQVERGFAVVNVTYRLTPSGTRPGRANMYPTAVNDVAAAVRWIHQNRNHVLPTTTAPTTTAPTTTAPVQAAAASAAAGSSSVRTLNLNTDTIIVAGHSAGATISALIGTGHNAPTAAPFVRTPKVSGWVGVAGIYDFTDPYVRKIADDWFANDAATRRAASAVELLDPSDPPAYLIHGQRDWIVPSGQMQRLVARGDALHLGERLHHDMVTVGRDEHAHHVPQCGMNVAVFNRWVDRIAAGTL